MMKQSLLAVLVIGCSAAGEPSPSAEEHSEPLVFETLLDCEAPSFNPDKELLETVTYATQRWTWATNEWPPACPITVADGGIPVIAQPYVFMGLEGDEIDKVFDTNPQLTRDQVCGVRQRNLEGTTVAIYISTDEPQCDVPSTVMHEIGHVLGPPQTHAPDGVNALPTYDRINAITEGTLTWACSKFFCTGYNPEYY